MAWAQSSASINRVRLLITDINDGRVSKIDTLLPLQVDIDYVLQSLGYDEARIIQYRASASEKRVITIETEEIQATDSPATIVATTAATTKAKQKILDTAAEAPAPTSWNQEPSRTASPNPITTLSQGNVADTPPSQNIAIASEVPSGDGSTSSPIVKQEIISANDASINAQWRVMTYNVPQSPTAMRKIPNIKVTVAEFDMFDSRAVNTKDATLLNRQPLRVSGFQVKPDFKEGYYKFSFNTEESGAQIRVFDVVGNLLYSENMSNTLYDKFIPDFDLFKQGTFLILVTLPDKKFTQKLILEYE